MNRAKGDGTLTKRCGYRACSAQAHDASRPAIYLRQCVLYGSPDITGWRANSVKSIYNL